MDSLDLKPITDWVGFKPGDLLQTREPVWLEREYWEGPDKPTYNIKIKKPGTSQPILGTDGLSDESLENNSFFEMKLEEDHPWVLKAEENGWQTAPGEAAAYSVVARAPLEKFQALVVRFEVGKYDDLIIETIIVGEKVYLSLNIDLFGTKDQAEGKLEAWEWCVS